MTAAAQAAQGQPDWRDLSGALKGTVKAWHAVLMEDRGARAALRRAQGVEDALQAGRRLDVLFDLLDRTGVDLDKEAHVNAMIAAGLAAAEIEEDRQDRRGALGRRLYDIMPYKDEQGSARFQVIAGTEDPALFLRLLRGAIAMKDSVGRDRIAPLIDTMETVRDWHWPASRAQRRRRLLLAYHGAFTPEEAEAPAPDAEREDAL